VAKANGGEREGKTGFKIGDRFLEPRKLIRDEKKPQERKEEGETTSRGEAGPQQPDLPGKQQEGKKDRGKNSTELSARRRGN